MLIKITNYCSMGCSHCMEGSTVAGEHMTRETFEGALDLTDRLESVAHESGIPRTLLISGGEATEHPDVLWFLERALASVDGRGIVILITNGMWLDDPVLRAAILRPEWARLSVQVTNDPRFYPRAPVAIPTDDPRVVFVPSLTVLVPLGRLKPAKAAALARDPLGLPTRKGPSSFNLRSMTRSFGDVRAAIAMMRARAATGMSGHCSPAISHDGTLVAGETNSCFAIGDIHSTPEQITRALIDMQCNRCGLVDGLSQVHKVAIGEAGIHPPTGA